MKFAKNDNNYRPLQLIHQYYNYKPYMSYKASLKRARKTILNSLNLGYGGFVTNVYIKKHGKGYLKDKRQFKILQGIMEIYKELGLKVWIYDECGYPSGAAAGLVVKNNPNAEAYGIVLLDKELKKGETAKIDLPYKHEKFKAAFFQTKDGVENITDLADENGSITFTAKANGKLLYLATKVLYEGVHATRKFGGGARYIDVLSKEAVKDFINITHEKYKEYIGEHFGNTIEAFFTDEPSVMSQYFPVLPTKSKPLDKIDNKIPLYKHIVWSRNFEQEFLNRKGYDIAPYIYMLFEGETEESYKVRIDYNEVCCELYKEAYFEAISAWCEENDLKLSGHLLGEENLFEQAYNEYDNFQMLKPMQYPGIDVLSCNPLTLSQEPLLLKTTSSEAVLHNKSVVMSETGFHLDHLDGIKPDKKRVLGAIVVQYANGINKITSYLGTKAMPKEDYHYVFDRVSKMGQILEGGSFVTPLLVYYTVKSCYKFLTPSEKHRDERDYHPSLIKIDNSIKNALLCFNEQKLDYVLIDNESFNLLKNKGKSLVTNTKNSFKAIYFPVCDFAAEKIEEKIIKLAENGAVIYLENSNFITERLRSTSGITIVENANVAAKILYTQKLNDIEVSMNKLQNLTYCHKEINGKEVYMFVNNVNDITTATITLKETKDPYFYNLIKQKKTSVKHTKTNKTITLDLKLEPYGVIFAVFE